MLARWIEIEVTLSERDCKAVERSWLDGRVKVNKKALLFVEVGEVVEKIKEKVKAS